MTPTMAKARWGASARRALREYRIASVRVAQLQAPHADTAIALHASLCARLRAPVDYPPCKSLGALRARELDPYGALALLDLIGRSVSLLSLQPPPPPPVGLGGHPRAEVPGGR